MKLCIKYNKETLDDSRFKVIVKFFKFLNSELPLKNDLEIYFLDKRIGKMTTGSFIKKKHMIKCLAKNRMISDIMRTVSHEWAHAFDRENLKIRDRTNIGGESENFANAISGALVKKFVKSNPQLKNVIYS
jgi:hypothetical protein